MSALTRDLALFDLSKLVLFASTSSFSIRRSGSSELTVVRQPVSAIEMGFISLNAGLEIIRWGLALLRRPCWFSRAAIVVMEGAVMPVGGVKGYLLHGQNLLS